MPPTQHTKYANSGFCVQNLYGRGRHRPENARTHSARWCFVPGEAPRWQGLLPPMTFTQNQLAHHDGAVVSLHEPSPSRAEVARSSRTEDLLEVLEGAVLSDDGVHDGACGLAS